MTAELVAREQIDARIHGLKVRLGQARAATARADTLAEKITLQRRVQELEQELASFRKRYWEEVARLEEDAA